MTTHSRSRPGLRFLGSAMLTLSAGCSLTETYVQGDLVARSFSVGVARTLECDCMWIGMQNWV